MLHCDVVLSPKSSEHVCFDQIKKRQQIRVSLWQHDNSLEFSFCAATIGVRPPKNPRPKGSRGNGQIMSRLNDAIGWHFARVLIFEHRIDVKGLLRCHCYEPLVKKGVFQGMTKAPINNMVCSLRRYSSIRRAARVLVAQQYYTLPEGSVQ